ncbi:MULTISPECIES: cbb3-type cytochrome c oxidase subunit I [Metallosphaera]|uniref:cbb3-type cytochrome c oxidase subunit I n=1 Tax=Metallosphaera TaxID=41980 RepID=UPI001F06DCEB|nr:cbb3-type cytochrome c oxidase subunit I [Metallosphaera sedula]MCH1770694.1 cbb3-type cytochrome c oxidase subunit I [Metallosphaera sedula]MCP6728892.1 cbb3-type cytochrome c oxidase subunit I [Metallosphaera sedula]
MGLKEFVVSLFQLDKDWTTRIVMAMLVMGVIWGLLGVIDSLMVRIQETMWGLSGTLVFTPQEYFASITLHAERDLFGFAQQVIYAIFIYFTIKLLNLQPRAKWLLNISFILINISMMFMEGPIVVAPTFNDNYFSATDWYYISPMGIPNYSNYVVSPLFFYGWLLLDAFTYLAGIWIVYHYYIASKQLKEKLPVPLVFFLMNTLLFMIGYSGVTAANVWDILAFYNLVPLNAIANQIAFWIFGHAVVYMAWMPAVGALYLLIPTLANKPLYSDRMGRISALLYLIFSNNVPIHHLYMVNLPVSIKILQEVLTYAVVVPSMLTFFNLWATVKGAQVKFNVITAFTVTSFTGAIAAGVTGISNATIAFDAIVHNTDWVVSHFHAMILLSIVPAAMAVLYFMIPMMTGKQWFSSKMAWVHWIGYVFGSVLFIVGYELQGFEGLVRRAEIYPRVPSLITAEVISTVGAVIAELATLVWFLNLVLTLVKGRNMNLEGVGLGQLIGTVGAALEWNGENINIPSLFSKNMIKKGLSGLWTLGIVGALVIVISMFPLAFSGNTYNAMPWVWIVLLSIGIVLISYPVLKGAKSL